MDLAEKITTGIAAIVIAVPTVAFAYYFLAFYGLLLPVEAHLQR